MKQSSIHCLLPRYLAFAFMACGTAVSHGQTTTQQVSLVPGWNAIWLEVSPVDTDKRPLPPADVFPATVSKVLSPKPLAGLAEFFAASPADQGPEDSPVYNQDGWEQWRQVDLSGSNNLAFITGNRPYLIEATAATTLTITGNVRYFRPTWNPDRYNLIGFALEGSPTFNQFFGPANGRHPVNKIFRLDAASGHWQLVSGSSPMVSNAAYWIFCSGPSDYMGPVACKFDFALSGRLNFGGPGDAVAVGSGIDTLALDLEELVFTNLGSVAATPKLELIAADSGTGSLELHVVRPTIDSLSYERGNQVDSTANDGNAAALGEVVDPQSTSVLTLGARRNWSSGQAGRTQLYRLSTAVPGAKFWLPVTALRGDLQLPDDLVPDSPSGKVAGLWVGEVILDTVTSIGEDGAPSRPAAGSAPIRILLHSNESGAVSMLSAVTIMQTKTADAQIAPEPVLVVDPARIPFFEGIKERNGKRVGLRLEAVAFDMPRQLDGDSQAGLLGEPTFLLLTSLPSNLQAALAVKPSSRTSAQNALIANSAAAIDAAKQEIETLLPDYLNSRSLRPPSLAEVYAFSWPLDGALGAGKTVRTHGARPLTLDPFHRSNPFRHVFDQQHARGPNIRRELEITFDEEQTSPDILRGRYQETSQGLSKSSLHSSGTLELRRVSTVDSLQGAL
jgi:hypothetical protein